MNPDIAPITSPQIKLMTRKLHWTIGYLTDRERDVLRQAALDRHISRFDASTAIEDLFLVTNPREDAEMQKAAVVQLKNLAKRYDHILRK